MKGAAEVFVGTAAGVWYSYGMSAFELNISVPDELKGFAESQAKRLGLPNAAAYLLHLLRRASEDQGLGGESPGSPKGADPFAFMDELAAGIPETELDRLPHDGSINLDHYLYGHAKKPEP